MQVPTPNCAHQFSGVCEKGGEGDGETVKEGSKSERTKIASFWYTFELISVALPPEST